MSFTWNGYYPSLRWTPTSSDALENAEKQMLSGVKIPFEQRMVRVGENSINTIKTASKGPPLVLIHGFGAGIGFWCGNIDALAQRYTVYAIDLLGFGRSSRPTFSGSTIEEAEEMWVSSIDQWAAEMGLDNFVLLGHSLGGYLSTCYTLKHPSKVRHLILADPWGVPPAPDATSQKSRPLKWRLIAGIATRTSPLSILRWAGPYGPDLVTRFRPDIAPKFQQIFPIPEPIVNPYIYHINAQSPPTGEYAFRLLTINIGFAKNPLINRIANFPPTLPTTFIYGSHTWMDREAGRAMMGQLKGKTNYVEVARSGHHLYIENVDAFNNAVLQVADHLDDNVGIINIQQKPEKGRADGGLTELILTE